MTPEVAMVHTDRILREHGVPYWISFGTLLGFHREGGIIDGDNDIDFCCRTEDLIGEIGAVRRELRELGFKTKVHSDPKRLKIIATLGGLEIAIAAFRKKGKYRVRNMWSIPARFFDGAGEIWCFGRAYPCHAPIDEYLEWVYSDWKTPMAKHLGRALYTKAVLRK